MQFNPNEYETVKSRKERFYTKFPDARITVRLQSLDKIMEYAVFEARVYKNAEDQKNQCPRGIGYATETRDTTKSISSKGKEYESVNYTSWTENAEESAVGRALDNAGYSGNKKPSREEMEKINRMSNQNPKQHGPVAPSTEPVYEPAKVETDNKGLDVHCETCNALMINKTGVNKEGKAWSGWFCPDDRDHAVRWI